MAATFGAMMFPTDYAIQPVELAQAVEERGLESLFFPEHTHIPTSRQSPWPGGGESAARNTGTPMIPSWR